MKQLLKNGKIFIYCLSDPRTNTIRYVGKTEQSLKARLKDHLRDKRMTHKTAWVVQLKRLSMEPIIEILEEFSPGTAESDWQEAEKFWISTLRFYGFPLTNMVEGGKGGGKPCAETTAKRRASLKGKKFSESHKKNLKIAFNKPEYKAMLSAPRGKASIETRSKISKANLGKKRTAEQLERLRKVKRSPEFRRKMSLITSAASARLRLIKSGQDILFP